MLHCHYQTTSLKMHWTRLLRQTHTRIVSTRWITEREAAAEESVPSSSCTSCPTCSNRKWQTLNVSPGLGGISTVSGMYNSLDEAAWCREWVLRRVWMSSTFAADFPFIITRYTRNTKIKISQPKMNQQRIGDKGHSAGFRVLYYSF